MRVREHAAPVISYLTLWCWMRRNVERRAPLELLRPVLVIKDGGSDWNGKQISRRHWITLWVFAPVKMQSSCQPHCSI